MPKYFNKTIFIILGFSILLLATGIRVYTLGQIPVSLYWDEAAQLLDARSVAETGLDFHGHSLLQTIYPSYGDYKLPGYILLAATSVKIFGQSEWSLRLPSVLAGVVTVIVAGLIARKIFSAKNQMALAGIAQLTTMLVVTLSPWAILFSRTGFEGHLAQALVGASILAILYALDSAKNNKRWFFVLLSILLGTFATYTYFSVRFVWPLIILAVSVRRKITKKMGLLLVLVLSLYALTLWPMMHSALYQASNQYRFSTKSILNAYDYPVIANQYRLEAGNTFLDRVVFHRHWLLLIELAKNIADHLTPNFLFLHGDANLRHGTGEQGLFLLPMLPLLLMGIYALLKRLPKESFFLFIWWLAALIPAAVPEDTPHALRSLNALIPLSVIIGIGSTYLISFFYKKYSLAGKRHVYKILLLTMALLYVGWIIFSAGGFIYFYFNFYPTKSALQWQDGYKQMASSIWNYQDSVGEVWVESFDDKFFIWLLLYGPLSSNTIQSLETVDYKVKKIDKIDLLDDRWSKISELEYPILIAGHDNWVEDHLRKDPITLVQKIPINTVDYQTPFSMAIIKRLE